MKEKINPGNADQHPDLELQLELIMDVQRLRHLYGVDVIDPLKKRVEIHNGDCRDCREVFVDNIKFY